VATDSGYLLTLIREALSDLENANARLSQVVQKAARIARLREDWVNWWWLELELVSLVSKQAIIDIQRHVVLRLPKDVYELLRRRFAEAWIKEREALTFDEEMKPEEQDNILAVGLGEIEVQAEKYKGLANQPPPPERLHPLDLYFVQKERSETRSVALALGASTKSIIERIKVRVHSFLSETEAQLILGQFHSDLFERNRRYVDLLLQRIAPEALEQLAAAYRRGTEGDAESRSQALLSCRRVLKSLADALYPPPGKPVIGADGQERDLTEEKYIARLWQFVFERVGRTTSGDLLMSNVHDLGNRIDRLYDLANKGVHDQVTQPEVDQCLIQTYLAAGDLLRVYERSSAIGLESELTTPPNQNAA